MYECVVRVARKGERVAAHQGFFKGTQNFAFIYFFTLLHTNTKLQRKKKGNFS